VEAGDAALAFGERGGSNLVAFQRLCRAENRPVNLARIVADEHQICSRRQRFAGHAANAEVEHGAHVEIVGDEQAVVAPALA